MRAKRSMRGARKRRKRARAPPAATTGKSGEKPRMSPSIAPNDVMAERPRRIFINDRECMVLNSDVCDTWIPHQVRDDK